MEGIEAYLQITVFTMVLGFGMAFLLWFVGFLLRTGIGLLNAVKNAA